MIGFSTKGNSIKDKVFNNIINKIQYLELTPGERIDENTIEEEIGASRTPRREAMMLLESEGLVNISPQKGTFVSLIDLYLIKEILYLRFTIENRVFNELAQKGIENINNIEKFLLMQELAVKNNDFVEFVKNDYLFHQELFNIAGHIEVWKMIEGRLIHCTRFRILGWKTYNNEFNQTLMEHKKIIEYIKTKNSEGLTETLTAHHDYDLKRYASKLLKSMPEYFTKQSFNEKLFY